MSFPYMQDGSGVSPPGEKLYSAYSQSILRKGRGMSEKNFEFIFSDTSSMGMKFSVGVPYSSTTTEEDFQELEQESSVDSSSTRCILQRKPRKGRKMLLHTPGNVCGYDPEKFGICNRSVSFLNPVQALRNLQHERMHSPGINVHFRCTHRLHAPSIIRSKPAINHAGSELPLCSPSAPSDEIEHPQIKEGLYKTELCRSWEETGHCRYAAKCQFAHGNDDLRPVPRHPKYKTELCRSYTETGLCSYGKRCRFIHTSGTNTQVFLESRNLEKKGSRRLSIFQQLSGAGEMPPRQA
ncbi:uncharacterized protein [Physcomitrium patens]|uniref:C3H1-type domain-containing protein n=1 Tax=Physcomitrium patens TaxID=3218 RepID=A0A2K1L1V7_PHYPA|nr:hypothetical protein PHYPA_002806 [Physcomitrium patens]